MSLPVSERIPKKCPHCWHTVFKVVDGNDAGLTYECTHCGWQTVVFKLLPTLTSQLPEISIDRSVEILQTIRDRIPLWLPAPLFDMTETLAAHEKAINSLKVKSIPLSEALRMALNIVEDGCFDEDDVRRIFKEDYNYVEEKKDGL